MAGGLVVLVTVLVGEEEHCVLCEQVAKLMVSF